MKLNISNPSLCLLLIFIGFAFKVARAEPPPLPRPDPRGCAKSNDAVKQRNAELYKKYAQGGTNDLLDKCRKVLDDHIASCDDEKKQNPNCQAIESSPPDATVTGGTRQTQITQADLLAKAANCHYSISHCYKYDAHFKKTYDGRTGNCLTGPDKVVIDASASDEDKEKARNVIRYYKDYQAQIQDAEAKCSRDDAAIYESQARDTEKAMGATAALDCMNHDDGTRVCTSRPNGSKFQTFPDGDKISTNGPMPAKIGDCSGSVLGDGVTVVTVKHCDHNNNSPVSITAYDAGGNARVVSGTCGPGATPDINICKLDTPIKANPVYFATLDKNSPLTDCVQNGYVLSCGEGYFQGLTTRPMTIWGFPYQYDETTGNGSQILARSQGTMFYDASRQALSYDALCTGGCSGSGVYTIDQSGRVVIVAAHAWGSRYSTWTGAPITPSTSYDSLKIQSVTTEKLAAGSSLFLQMPLR
jgi:hypothetical protein